MNEVLKEGGGYAILVQHCPAVEDDQKPLRLHYHYNTFRLHQKAYKFQTLFLEPAAFGLLHSNCHVGAFLVHRSCLVVDFLQEDRSVSARHHHRVKSSNEVLGGRGVLSS